MKTKEQIIDQHKSIERRQSDSKMFGGYDFVFLTKQGASSAMDEYSKQQAIAFDFYRREQGYILNYANHEYMKFGAEYINEPRLSPEELYAQFIEQQNTNK